MKKSYLEKSALYPAFINTPPNKDLELVIVIPAYDEPELIKTLFSLKACERPPCSVEVIIVVNYQEYSSPEVVQRIQTQYKQIKDWTQQHNDPTIYFHVLFLPDLPRKKAGVGLARKIGMDEGVRRLLAASDRIDDPNGILICFDADSLCRSDYFLHIHSFFHDHPKIDALSIGYAHPLEGEEYPDRIYQSIAAYELHLRYFLLAKKMSGCPHAIETIGSAMAVRQWAYQQQGGMNQRKAGEDFYFLHKFIATGRTAELSAPLVIPSPRISHRVPFGTGKAVGDLITNDRELDTYALAIFLELKQLTDQVDHLFQLSADDLDDFLMQMPPSLQAFLQTQSFRNRIEEIQKNTSDLIGFRKRFYRWMDAFLVMKYVHFARDHFHKNVPVSQAALALLEKYFSQVIPDVIDMKSLLKSYRQLAMNQLKPAN